MPDTTFALTLLSLFTTADKAAEIEGDLLEQSRVRGRAWFWWQVQLTCIALFFHGLRQEAGKILLFSYAIYELLFKFGYWVLNPMRRALARALDARVSEMPLTNGAIDVLFGFTVGMLLVRLFPKHGGQIFFIVFGLAFGRVALLRSVPEAAAIALFGGVPALLGALLMKWMELRRDGGSHNARARPISRT
jgi:hypothetical protein